MRSRIGGGALVGLVGRYCLACAGWIASQWPSCGHGPTTPEYRELPLAAVPLIEHILIFMFVSWTVTCIRSVKSEMPPSHFN